jgi:thiamine pyrophosphokinase
MTALILAGGSLTVTPALLALAAQAALVIAADSGLRHAQPLGLSPDLIVGDFDSVNADDLARYPHVPHQRHPPEKDRLDLELAVDEALKRGAKELIIAGGLGDRFDQSLAAVLLVARLKGRGERVFMHSGDKQVHVLAGSERLMLPLPSGQRFSLLSLAPATIVSVSNAKYPLDRHRLELGVGLGVSNEVAATPLEVVTEAGLVAVIVE